MSTTSCSVDTQESSGNSETKRVAGIPIEPQCHKDTIYHYARKCFGVLEKVICSRNTSVMTDEPEGCS